MTYQATIHQLGVAMDDIHTFMLCHGDQVDRNAIESKFTIEFLAFLRHPESRTGDFVECIKQIISEYRKGLEFMTKRERRIKKLVCDMLGNHAESNYKLTATWEDLGADSLDRVDLILAFESEFNIEIDDEQAAKINTVQDAVNYIGRHAGQHA